MAKEYWDILDENGEKTGRVHERGLSMKAGEYHLSVTVWIRNKRGEFLISQRAPGKNMPLMWEPTGGGVIAGEDSVTAALREVREELGIELHSEEGRVWKRYTWPHSNGNGSVIIDLWVFDHDVDISEVTLQPEETCDAMWADKERIRGMISRGEMVCYTYIDDLFVEF